MPGYIGFSRNKINIYGKRMSNEVGFIGEQGVSRSLAVKFLGSELQRPHINFTPAPPRTPTLNLERQKLLYLILSKSTKTPSSREVCIQSRFITCNLPSQASFHTYLLVIISMNITEIIFTACLLLDYSTHRNFFRYKYTHSKRILNRSLHVFP